MGRKKIEKAPKTPKAEEEDHSGSEENQEPAVEPQAPQQKEAPAAKGGKRGKAKQSEVKESKTEKAQKQAVLFSEEFVSKVDTFKNFYRSYLEHRANSEQLNVNSQFEKISENVRSKIEKACSKVLKEDVSDAEKWIEEKIGDLRTQIHKVEAAEANVKSAYEEAGTFTAAEVESHLKGVKDKRANFQQCIKDLQQIKDRAHEIYGASGMDEE